MNNASVFTCYDHFLHDLPFAAKSKKLTTSRSIRTRASLAWAYLYHYSNPYIKKPFERTTNNTLPQKSKSLHHFFFLLDHSSCYCPSSNSLYGHEARLGLSSLPKLSSSPIYKHMRWPRKVSSILQTSAKFSKNPSGKTLQNCFIHKSSTGSRLRAVSYFSLQSYYTQNLSLFQAFR